MRAKKSHCVGENKGLEEDLAARGWWMFYDPDSRAGRVIARCKGQAKIITEVIIPCSEEGHQT